MRKFKSAWLLVSVSLLPIVACAPIPETEWDYEVCDDTQANNQCPDENTNIQIEGM